MCTLGPRYTSIQKPLPSSSAGVQNKDGRGSTPPPQNFIKIIKYLCFCRVKVVSVNKEGINETLVLLIISKV